MKIRDVESKLFETGENDSRAKSIKRQLITISRLSSDPRTPPGERAAAVKAQRKLKKALRDIEGPPRAPWADEDDILRQYLDPKNH